MPPSPNLYLLVVAHPDDESMFFAPTLDALLRRQETQLMQQQQQREQTSVVPSIHILSLSNGNYDGLGKVREAELRRAAGILGMSLEGDGGDGTGNTVEAMDVGGMQDGPDEVWDKDVVADAVWGRVRGILDGQRGLNGQDGGSESKKRHDNVAVLTFDEGGVSGHPNHVDVCRGIRHLLATHASRRRDRRRERTAMSPGVGKEEGEASLPPSSSDSSLRVWELVTIVNPLAKYCPLFELISMALSRLCSAIAGSFGKFAARQRRGSGKGDTSFLGMGEVVGAVGATCTTYRMFRPILVWYAMAAHTSQFVWYRRLSVLFSRYTYANTLREVEWSGGAADKKYH